MIPKIVAAALDKTRSASGFYLNEGPGLLVTGGTLTWEHAEVWRQACSLAAGSWCDIQATDLIGAPVEFNSVDKSDWHDGEIRVVIATPQTTGSIHLFTIDGLRQVLSRADALAGISVVRVADDFPAFRTRANFFEPWVGEPAAAAPRALAVSGKNPRRFVRSLLSEPVVPLEAEPWLLNQQVASSSSVFAAWQTAATHWMSRAFLNEVFEEDGAFIGVLHGPPTRRLVLGAEGPLRSGQFDTIAEPANWIFGDGTDVEVRHTLFSIELARSWVQDEGYFDAIFDVAPTALDGARMAYAAHLRSGSRETIRSLADLRKTLFDEMQRVAQQTRDLATSLWRDMAIAIGVMAFRAAMDVAKPTTRAYGFVLLGTAIYLIASLVMSTSTSMRFLRVANKSQKVWRTRLYGFLTEDEFSGLAAKPIKETVWTFYIVLASSWVITCVVVLVLILLAAQLLLGNQSGFFCENLGFCSPPPLPSTP